MNEVGISFLSLFIIGAGVGVIFLFVLLFGMRRNPLKRGTPSSSSIVAATDENSGDESAAPITPHDPHRDLTVAKAIIERLDQLDAMIKSAAKRNDDDMAGQLELFRDEMIGLLRECEVEKFEFAPGAVVDTEMRNRIQIVGGEAKGGPSKIVETVRCGFRYLHGDADTMILRKAEVVTG